MPKCFNKSIWQMCLFTCIYDGSGSKRQWEWEQWSNWSKYRHYGLSPLSEFSHQVCWHDNITNSHDSIAEGPQHDCKHLELVRQSKGHQHYNCNHDVDKELKDMAGNIYCVFLFSSFQSWLWQQISEAFIMLRQMFVDLNVNEKLKGESQETLPNCKVCHPRVLIWSP